jgi:FkbM family methyltransferase
MKTVLGFDLLLDPDDYFSKLLARDGVFEAPESEMISRLVHTGDTCVDAGCHVGYYTCLLAQLVGDEGRVFAFDGNPGACEATKNNLSHNGLTWVEVTHAVLADYESTSPFYISTDDQTGLSSRGELQQYKGTITVPCVRLQDSLNERHVEHVRLLKIDVEGSEKALLSGLGRFLTNHLVDYIVIELYDERLRLMNTSTEEVAEILRRAGYQAWEHGRTTGWSRTNEVRSRGDCSYLFISPSAREPVPRFCLAGLLAQAQADLTETKEALAKAREDNDWLVDKLSAREQEIKGLHEEIRRAQETLNAIQNSAGWRMLNVWRRMRDNLAPEKSGRRKVYDLFAGFVRR